MRGPASFAVLAAFLSLALLACAEVDGPTAPPTPETVAARGGTGDLIEVEKPRPTFFQGGTPLLPAVQDCERGSVGCDGIYVGTTHLVGWLVPGAGAAAERKTGLSGFTFVVHRGDDGPSDTIPQPPAPFKRLRADRVMAEQYASVLGQAYEAAGLDGPSDTIPLPPAPFVIAVGDDALFLFGVHDLVVKGVIEPVDRDGAALALLWSEKTSPGSRQHFQADGVLPPSDTIPPAPFVLEERE